MPHFRPIPSLVRCSLLALCLGPSLAVVTAARPALAAAPTVQVAGERITLGDINPTLPREVLTLDLAPAPLPGRSITISRDAIRGALDRSGADPRLADGLPARVEVSRQAKQLMRSDLSKEVTDLARAQLPLGVSIDGILGLENVTLPDVSHELELRLGRLRQSTKATVIIKAEGRTWFTQPVTLNLSGTPQTPTLKRSKPRRAVIEAGDVVMAPTTFDRLPTRAALRKGDLVGHVLTQPATAGHPIQTTALQPKPVVERGREINLILVGKGLRITQSVRADEDGGQDEWIRVRAVDGGRTMQAQVVSAGEVQIDLGGGSK